MRVVTGVFFQSISKGVSKTWGCAGVSALMWSISSPSIRVAKKEYASARDNHRKICVSNWAATQRLRHANEHRLVVLQRMCLQWGFKGHREHETNYRRVVTPSHQNQCSHLRDTTATGLPNRTVLARGRAGWEARTHNTVDLAYTQVRKQQGTGRVVQRKTIQDTNTTQHN